jgi:hypothetical protein
MHGHMGVKQRMQMGLKVIAVDEANDVVFIKGCVPGYDNSWVTIRDAVKKKQPEGLPFPAGLKQTSRRADEQTSVSAAKEESSPDMTNQSSSDPVIQSTETGDQA